MNTDALRAHGDLYVREGLLDFAVNVRPGRPAGLKRALEVALADERYPDTQTAREALARLHDVESKQVLLLNGACEGFWLLAQTLRPSRATVFHPTFSEGELALRAVGAAVDSVPLAADWSLDTDAVEADSPFVVVTNPNNPSGRLESAETVETLTDPRRLLVVDESFMDFASDRETLLHGPLPGVVVLRSCTKLLSLAAVRAGYLITEPDLVGRLEAARQPWPVNGLACAALVNFATDRQAVAARVAEARADREDLAARLRGVPGVHIFPSETNFLLVRLPRRDVPERLRQLGVAVRPSAGFRGLSPAHIRVAARSPEDNEVLVARLALVLAGA
jgi:histidinol-phosphate/aromatic aminotransferase/cobyric acid decarboxylase-like protein